MILRVNKVVIGLLRHYKVDHKWKLFCSSLDFQNECEKYDHANILAETYTRETEYKIFTSALKRSFDTAKSIFPDNKLHATNLLNEVPISPFSNTKIKLPITLWMLFGRIHWMKNKKTQSENRNQTKRRMEQLIEKLENEGSDCILVGHGFYFYEFSKLLEHRNYFTNGNRRLGNGEYVEYTLNFT